MPVARRLGIGAALTAVAVTLFALLTAPAASAAGNCVNAYDPATGALAGSACVNTRQGLIEVSDVRKDGHHVTGYWSTTGYSSSCSTNERASGLRCVLAKPGHRTYNHVQVCFRAAQKEGSTILYLSERACVTLNGDY